MKCLMDLFYLVTVGRVYQIGTRLRGTVLTLGCRSARNRLNMYPCALWNLREKNQKTNMIGCVEGLVEELVVGFGCRVWL